MGTRAKPKLPTGLVWRGDTIHIATSVNGRRIRRSTGTGNPRQAQEQLDALRGALRLSDLTGVEVPVLRRQATLTAFAEEVLAEMAADGAAETTLTK